MAELFPIGSGLLVGLLLGRFRSGMSLRATVTLAIGIGALATVVSREFELGWGYLLVDVPLAAVSLALGVFIGRLLESRAARHA